MHHSLCLLRACKLLFLSQILSFCFVILIHHSSGDASRYPGAFGDPHFTGWDGVNFDFTGEEGVVYCMISDEQFHMNMKLGGRTKLGTDAAKHDGGVDIPVKYNGANGQALQEEEVGRWAMRDTDVGRRTKQDEEMGRWAMQDGDAGQQTKQEAEEAAGWHTKRKQTWIKEIGIMYRGHRMEMVAKEGGDVRHEGSFMRRLEINGEEKLNLLKREGDVYVSEDKGVRIEYEKKESYGVMQFDLYKVVLGCLDSKQFLEEIVMKVKVGPEVPEERDPDGHDAFFHLSIEMVGGQLDFWTGAVHGLLGQSLLNARGRSRLRGLGSYKTSWNPLLVQMQVEGPNGDGYLDGNVSDYVSSDLLNSDCRFSRFNPNLLAMPLPTAVSSGYSRRLLPGFSPY